MSLLEQYRHIFKAPGADEVLADLAAFIERLPTAEERGGGRAVLSRVLRMLHATEPRAVAPARRRPVANGGPIPQGGGRRRRSPGARRGARARGRRLAGGPAARAGRREIARRFQGRRRARALVCRYQALGRRRGAGPRRAGRATNGLPSAHRRARHAGQVRREAPGAARGLRARLGRQVGRHAQAAHARRARASRDRAGRRQHVSRVHGRFPHQEARGRRAARRAGARAGDPGPREEVGPARRPAVEPLQGPRGVGDPHADGRRAARGTPESARGRERPGGRARLRARRRGPARARVYRRARGPGGHVADRATGADRQAAPGVAQRSHTPARQPRPPAARAVLAGVGAAQRATGRPPGLRACARIRRARGGPAGARQRRG